MSSSCIRTGLQAGLITVLACATTNAQVTRLVSETEAGLPIIQACTAADVTDDGRFVSFQSITSALETVSNGRSDIFVRDMATGSYERVSEPTGGGDADGHSYNADMSPDGRWVVFESDATNLVIGDTNASRDIFLHDRLFGITNRVSTGSGGTQSFGLAFGPVVSDDGRIVAFYSSASDLIPSDGNGTFDIFVKDRDTDTTTLVSRSTLGLQAELPCTGPSLSGDGRFVSFHSKATTLSLSDTNGDFDVFLHDRQAGTTERVSNAPDGTVGDGASTGGHLSQDGTALAFVSDATNLIAFDPTSGPDVYVRNLTPDTTHRVAGSANATVHGLNTNGRFVLMTTDAPLAVDDTNGKPDVYVHDRFTGEATRASVNTAGEQATVASATPAMGSDSRYVVFQSLGANLAPGTGPGSDTDVFRRDTKSAFTDLRAGLAGATGVPELSGTGNAEPGTLISVVLTDGLPSATTFLVFGLAEIGVPFKGGTLVPSPDIVATLATSSSGGFILPALWPANAPSGVAIYMQAWIQDGAGPAGFAASNGLAMETP